VVQLLLNGQENSRHLYGALYMPEEWDVVDIVTLVPLADTRLPRHSRNGISNVTNT
jgi:hypothetical protein